jgi:molybdopterin-synthase adenylyltransferase
MQRQDTISPNLYHEALYRSGNIMRKLRDLPVTICGAGALGGNLTESLARQGFGRLRVIDRDRIEERNLSTQPFYRSDIGAYKARILSNSLYRAVGVSVEAKVETLTPGNAPALLKGSGLVVDAFDNSSTRQAVKDACDQGGLPCLHIGLAAEYAEVIWNETYRVPSAAQDDICDYPLARNLVLLTVAVAAESIVAFATSRERRSHTITLADLAVRPSLPNG